MSQKSVKTFSVQANSTFSVLKSSLSGGLYTKKQNQYSSPVRIINPGSATGEEVENIILFWKIDSNLSSLLDINLDPDNMNIRNVSIEIYSRNADSPYQIDDIEIVPLASDPTFLSATDLYNATISGTAYTTYRFSGNYKKSNTITIGNSITDQACLDVKDTLINGTYFTVVLRRKTTSTTDGYVDIGGQNMLNGTDNPWRITSGDEIAFLPTITIQYEEAATDVITFDMRYTTTDPTTDQNTPSNSLGGYFSPNNVFVRSQIGDDMSNSQKTLTVSSDADNSFPEATTGMIQVGTEIIRYSSIDVTNRLLSGLSRGVVPFGGAFSNSVQEHADFVNYLDPSLLFDRNPTEGLSQHRCVAIFNPISANAFGCVFYLVQDPNADVQIDIGIEVPAFDSRNISLSSDVSSGSNTFYTTATLVQNYATDFFVGGYITLDITGTPISAIITAYSSVGGIAQFTVDRSLSSLTMGTICTIYAAPSQIISNETDTPISNNDRFFGFTIENGASNDISFNNIRENKGVVATNDIIYLWIKRTLKKNSSSKLDTGSLIIISYNDFGQLV